MGDRASDLAVIIPTRERWHILGRTLEALRSQSVNGFEVLLVVDGDEGGPAELDGATIIRTDKGGPGRARNIGAAATSRPLVLFLGDDVIPTPRLVEMHLDGHQRHPNPESAVLGLSVWHPDTSRNRVMSWMEWSGVQFDYPAIQGEDAGWGRFYSSNVSLKREFFLAVGGFDEDFEYDYEDLDFGYRASLKGLKLWYEPEALGHHLHQYDLDRLVARYRSHAIGERLMAQKHSWFSPYFAARIQDAINQPKVAAVWPAIADHVPTRLQRLSNRSRQRASVWFHQELADAFTSSWDGQDDLDELRAYLGGEFDLNFLWNHRAEVELEIESYDREEEFYRNSHAYLYDLTAFAMWGTKLPYRRVLERLVPPGSRLLDYGCGIGTDGLRLIERGYSVSFADFANPSIEYLRWRLAKRGIEAEVFDIDKEVPAGFDAAYSFDVIEHVEDPFAFLSQLEKRAHVVIVNLLEEDETETHVHRPLPVSAILDHAESKGLLHYRVYSGRSHLVAYQSHGVAGLESRVRRVAGFLEHKLEPWASRVRRALLR